MKRVCRYVNGQAVWEPPFTPEEEAEHRLLPRWLKPQRGCKVSPGQRFGRFTVAGLPFRTICKNGGCQSLWRVVAKCDCGSVHVISISRLQTQGGCGCLRRRHGMYNTPQYRTWIGMKSRCNNKHRRNYGAKGITVCEEWNKDFKAFLAWGQR